jgi:hypothetical protein
MFIIIIHHFGVHGINPYFHNYLSQDWGMNSLPWQYVFTQFMCWGGNLGNSIFILITGYFMITRKVNYKKIVLLTATLFFYSWLIMIVLYGGHLLPFSFVDMVESLLPIWFGRNWFVSCYIIFSLFIPFLNRFLNRLSQQSYLAFLLLFYIIFLVLPIFKFVNFMSQAQFWLFTFVYSLGGYFRLYDKKILQEKFSKYIKQSLVCLCLILLSILLTFFLGSHFHKINLIEMNYNQTTFLQVLLAASTFRLFLALPPFYSSLINKLAGTVLGIYLIHDNNLIRPFLWHTLFPNVDFLYSEWYIVFYVFKVLVVFIICAGIEFVRKKFLEPIVANAIDKYFVTWCYWGEKTSDYLMRKILNL